MAHILALCDPGPIGSADVLITLRSAQVRRISWVRGVRPVRERRAWPPQEAAPDRPPRLSAYIGTRKAEINKITRFARKEPTRCSAWETWGGFVLACRAPRLLDLGFAELDVLA